MAELKGAYDITMDTIIYLYHGREQGVFVTEKWQEREYCLIRLGIPALLWKNLRCLERENTSKQETVCKEQLSGEGIAAVGMPSEFQQTAEPETEQRTKRRILRLFRTRRGNRKRRYESMPTEIKEIGENADKEKKVRAIPEELQELLEELERQQTALRLLGDNPNWTYCVYEDFLRERIDTEYWWDHWSIPEFEEYHDYIWAEELMKHAVCDRSIILGNATCIPRILREHARRMRGVKWFLKAEEFTQELQQFLDTFYEEYGLAVEVHSLQEDENWYRVRPSSTVPVNVLDFAGEEKLSACDVAKGSVWLDMDSQDGKWRRMEARNPGVSYFSLKKQWKQLQKDPINLDTIHKNGYNT